MKNYLSLQGKHVLVTGASSGMGKVFAQMIAGQGARVSLLARNEERLEQTRNLLEGEGHNVVCCDLTDEEQLRQAAETMQPRVFLFCSLNLRIN